MRAHLLQRLDQVGQAFERVVLALHRDQHRVRRAQAVEREQRQRRRTVEQDEVVVRCHFADRGLHLRQRFGQRVLQPRFAFGQVDQLDLRAGQFAIRGHEVEAAGRRRHAHVRDAALAQQHLVHGGVEAALVEPGTRRGIALRIEVDQQHAPLHRDQARGEVDRGGRLADAALLVGHCDDARHRCRLSSGIPALHDDEVARRVEAGDRERRRGEHDEVLAASARVPRPDARPSSRTSSRPARHAARPAWRTSRDRRTRARSRCRTARAARSPRRAPRAIRRLRVPTRSPPAVRNAAFL